MKKLFLVLFCLYTFGEVELLEADVHLSSSPSSTRVILEPGEPINPKESDAVMNQYTILSDIDQTNDLPITYRYSSTKKRTGLEESTTSLCNPNPKSELDGAIALVVAQIIGVADQNCPIQSGVYTKPSHFNIDLSNIGVVLQELFLFPDDEYTTVQLDIGDRSLAGYIDIDR